MSATNKLKTLLTKEHHLKDVLKTKCRFQFCQMIRLKIVLDCILVNWIPSGSRQIYKSIEDPKQKSPID